MSATATPPYAALGLTRAEYDEIVCVLGREPSRTELAMFSVMWSEHCSYKSSRRHLRELPTEGPDVVAGPGEGAGVVRVSPDVFVAFKMESHNHPSAVEPFQGAATGVGGIVRDVLSLGARPIALLDPLRFGPLDDRRQRYLFDGVVRGIAAYGNALGLPTVGGEAVFDPAYAGNPLVNVMCVGIIEDGTIVRARPRSAGELAVLIGSRTGRDGIGGASVLASQDLTEDAPTKRPSVQVGDPFTEKLLIEACLELKRLGLLSGMQDLGAGGITCALSETAAAASLGVEGDLDRVPLREVDMEPWEISISESQERMLACVAPERIERVLETCERWGLEAAVVARYTTGGRVVLHARGDIACDVPARALAEGPAYDRALSPADRRERLTLDPTALPWPDPEELLVRLLATPTVASKEWVWRQYDHMVRLNTLVVPGWDAAVLRVPESRRGEPSQPGIALATDGAGRLGSLDPYSGGALAVCESARNVACLGARPAAITDCLNFASPERPEVMDDFVRTVRGLGDACRAFGIPVVGGNVSFYNESPGGAVHPTPVVGMVGVLDDAYAARARSPREGERIVLLGSTRPELGGSEALAVVHGLVGGSPPPVNVGAEVALVRMLATPGIGTWAHDLSEGGLGVALAELCLAAGAGATVELPDDVSPLAALFAETGARALVTCQEAALDRVLYRAAACGVPARVLGRVGGGALEVAGVLATGVDVLRSAWEGAIPSLMDR